MYYKKAVDNFRKLVCLVSNVCQKGLYIFVIFHHHVWYTAKGSLVVISFRVI